MPMPVKLSDKLINAAKIMAATTERSVPKQIEYWAAIGKIAEENPDLPLSLVKDICLAREEINRGEFTAYQFG